MGGEDAVLSEQGEEGRRVGRIFGLQAACRPRVSLRTARSFRDPNARLQRILQLLRSSLDPTPHVLNHVFPPRIPARLVPLVRVFRRFSYAQLEFEGDWRERGGVGVAREGVKADLRRWGSLAASASPHCWHFGSDALLLLLTSFAEACSIRMPVNSAFSSTWRSNPCQREPSNGRFGGDAPFFWLVSGPSHPLHHHRSAQNRHHRHSPRRGSGLCVRQPLVSPRHVQAARPHTYSTTSLSSTRSTSLAPPTRLTLPFVPPLPGEC